MKNAMDCRVYRVANSDPWQRALHQMATPVFVVSLAIVAVVLGQGCGGSDADFHEIEGYYVGERGVAIITRSTLSIIGIPEPTESTNEPVSVSFVISEADGEGDGTWLFSTPVRGAGRATDIRFELSANGEAQISIPSEIADERAMGVIHGPVRQPVEGAARWGRIRMALALA